MYRFIFNLIYNLTFFFYNRIGQNAIVAQNNILLHNSKHIILYFSIF